MKQRKRILKEGPGAGYRLDLRFNPNKILSQDFEIQNNVASLDITFKGDIDANWEGYDWGGEEDSIKATFMYNIEFNLQDIKIEDYKILSDFLEQTFSSLLLDDNEEFLSYIIEFLENPDIDMSDVLYEFEDFLIKEHMSLADLYSILEKYNKKLPFEFFDTFFDVVVDNSYFYLKYDFVYGAGYSHSNLPEEFTIPIDEQLYCEDVPLYHNIINIYIKSPDLADLVNISYEEYNDEDY